MNRFKLFLPIIVFILLVLLLLRGLDEGRDPNALPSALINKPFPKFSMPLVKNPQMTKTDTDMLGKVSLVNVWGTWCVTCRAEHEFLLEVSEKYGIPIYGVNWRDERDKAQRWLTQLGDPYEFSVFDQEGKLIMDLGVHGAPETFVVDHLGVIQWRHTGDVNKRNWQSTLWPLVQKLQQSAASTVQAASTMQTEVGQ